MSSNPEGVKKKIARLEEILLEVPKDVASYKGALLDERHILARNMQKRFNEFMSISRELCSNPQVGDPNSEERKRLVEWLEKGQKGLKEIYTKFDIPIDFTAVQNIDKS